VTFADEVDFLEFFGYGDKCVSVIFVMALVEEKEPNENGNSIIHGDL
jgi:hypothetical protein